MPENCEHIDKDKQREGAALIERGLQLMREADPHINHGMTVAWALCYGAVIMDGDEDLSHIDVMLPVEGVSWPLLIGILRGSSIKVERYWLKSMEVSDED